MIIDNNGLSIFFVVKIVARTRAYEAKTRAYMIRTLIYDKYCD